MLDFIVEKLWRPIVERTGYTPYTTAAMAVLFVFAVEIIWKFVRKVDQKELRATAIPWIVLAGLVRFADSRAFPASVITNTPGIFVLMIGLFGLSLLAAGFDRTRKLGIILAIAFVIVDLPFLGFSRAAYLIPIILICLAVRNIYSRFGFMSDSFSWRPHIFEAWVTSFGVYAGLIEEHVLANIIMGINPFLFGVVKTLLMPVIVYLIKDLEGSQKLYIGTVVGAIGLVPGIRDMLELLSL